MGLPSFPMPNEHNTNSSRPPIRQSLSRRTSFGPGLLPRIVTRIKSIPNEQACIPETLESEQSNRILPESFRRSSPSPSSSLANRRAGTIEHFELFPFENAVKAKNASDGMISSHADEMLRFKRFFKSLIKELGENPEMTLAQISAKVGQLYNPFTGKPAEKYFFLKLLKEAKKISYRALIRNNKVSSRYGYPSLSSSKELVTAVSQILSSSGLDGDQQYTKNTDSLLPEVCFIISIYSHHVGFKFSWNSVHDCQIMIFY